ncbi:hypothetical protein [Mycobacteroides franklinii]|uniref:hypothetical protein n=1 Tax=Mycobacteroides franklinii TaxID=948102 RepID=UPI0018E373E9|nr:hypothetical protein [Mycobacteroides franklinii]
MTAIRGIVAGAFAIAMASTYQVATPTAYAMPEIRVMCEQENAIGDCIQDPPGVQNGGDGCVLVNELGACEDQQEVDDPAHTMLR